MADYINKKAELNSDVQNFCKWSSFLPFLGILSGTGTVLFQTFRGKIWSFDRLLLNFMPLVFFSLLYLCLYFVVKRKWKYSIPFFNRKIRVLGTILCVLYLSLNIFFWKYNQRFKYEYINATEFQELVKETNKNNSEDFFALFGSSDCFFCKKMETIYEAAFFRKRLHIYYVDLTYEPMDKSFAQEQNLMELPLFVHYNKGKEIGRIVGTTSVEKLTKFITDQ